MDDLISRQAAINALENTECELLPEEWDELTDAIMNVPSAQPSSYEMINEAHNEGFDVGYWAGRRDYEQKCIPVSERLQSEKPEALTDSEKRIFLAAMERERKICQAIDDALDNKECDTGLQYMCREIKRKVKGALWTI